MPIARANSTPSAAPSSATLRQQVYAQLRSAIEQGRWPAGTRLPSSRTHAGLLGVSRNTVLWAVQRLLAEGDVEARVGDGTYVAQALAPRPRASAPVQWRCATAHTPAGARWPIKARRWARDWLWQRAQIGSLWTCNGS